MQFILKSERSMPSAFFFLKLALAILVFSWFPSTFRIVLFLWRIPLEFFYRDFIESVDCISSFRFVNVRFIYLGDPLLCCCCSVAQWCPTLCDPMDCRTPVFPVLHHLLELAQTHVHWVSDIIQLPYPLPLPSPPAFNLCQHQVTFLKNQFFTSGGPSNGVSASASVLPVNIQDWFPLVFTDLISLQPQGLSRVFSNTTVQKHRFFSVQSSLWSNSYMHTWLLEKP